MAENTQRSKSAEISNAALSEKCNNETCSYVDGGVPARVGAREKNLQDESSHEELANWQNDGGLSWANGDDHGDNEF